MLIAVLGALLVGVVVVASVALSGGTKTHTVKGSLTLFDHDTALNVCRGTGGYDDIHEGAQVVVTDEAGKTLATGALESPVTQYSNGYSTGCKYDFTIEKVPDAKFFGVAVARRGSIQYSKAEMQSKDWAVSLSLGS